MRERLCMCGQVGAGVPPAEVLQLLGSLSAAGDAKLKAGDLAEARISYEQADVGIGLLATMSDSREAFASWSLS
jgi:hypothetical protein